MVDAYDKNGNKLDGIFKKDKTNKPEGEILINLKQKYFINSKTDKSSPSEELYDKNGKQIDGVNK